MTLTLGSQGAQSRFFVEPGAAAHTFDSSSESYEFISENVVKRGTIFDTNGIRGTRSHASARTRAGIYEVGGPIVMPVSPLMLDLWLPRILGANESTDTFALAETLQPFGLLFGRVGGNFQYTDCYVNRAVFRGQQGGGVELELDVIGATEVTGTSLPSVALSHAANEAPYQFYEAVFTLFGATRTTMEFELTIDNLLAVRFANSQTATSITPTDRVITLRTRHPFTSTEMSALYGLAAAGATGSVAITNSGLSTTFTFAILQAPDNSPSIQGKSEVILPLEMVARETSSTKELVVTNDSAA